MIELEIVPFHPELDLKLLTRSAKWERLHRRVKNPGVPMSGQTFLVEGQPRKVMSVHKWLSETQALKDTYVVRLKHVGQPQPRRMQCKDLDSVAFLKVFNTIHLVTMYSLVGLGFPVKLMRAKLAKLCHQGYLEEYSFSYKLTNKGLALITK